MAQITADNLYNMNLGDRFAPTNNDTFIRVPGGWIYGDMQGTCFVPFDNEYQEDAPQIKEEKIDNSQHLKAEIAAVADSIVFDLSGGCVSNMQSIQNKLRQLSAVE